MKISFNLFLFYWTRLCVILAIQIIFVFQPYYLKHPKVKQKVKGFKDLLHQELVYNYTYNSLPVINGKTGEILICFLIRLIEENMEIQNFQLIHVLLYLLSNIFQQFYCLSECTIQIIFSFLHRQENYNKFAKQPIIYEICYQIIHLILYTQTKEQQIDLQVYLFLNRDMISRYLIFGDSKEKLGFILFNENRNEIEQSEKKIDLELNDEEIIELNELYNFIQSLKKKYETNNYQSIIQQLSEFLSRYSYSQNHFKKPKKLKQLLKNKQTDLTLNQINKSLNLLQEDDQVFLQRLVTLSIKYSIEGIQKDNLKQLIFIG